MRDFFLQLAVLVSALSCPLLAIGGANFTCIDPEILQAAEQARIRSAIFWSGQLLPGTWFSPCPIEIGDSLPPGSGRTSFQFAKGEVFGWRMEVAGSRSELQEDVIPHEVDHIVRASLTRCSIERWLDEGCAAVMESPRSQARLRERASALDASLISEVWLADDNYPASPHEMEQLYALGFSLVEFLLSREPAATLLAFQRDRCPILVRLKRYYGLDLDSLQNGWAEWKCGSRQGTPSWPTIDSPTRRPRVPLTIWTATWCGPCQKFRSDFETNAEFRISLQTRYVLEFRDYDQDRDVAAARGIQLIPAFVSTNMPPLTGYQGADDLLRRLALSLPSQPPILGPDPAPALPVTTPSLDAPLSADPSTPIVVPLPLPLPIANEREPPGLAPTEQLASIPRWLPFTWSVLQIAGVVGGSLATGGFGGLAMAAGYSMLKHRLSRKTAQGKSQGSPERSAAALPAPFPRELDEACELLAIRQTEGRVAALDTLRGMFLDDELEKLEQSDPVSAQLAQKLRKSIDTRVDEIAPLTAHLP